MVNSTKNDNGLKISWSPLALKFNNSIILYVSRVIEKKNNEKLGNTDFPHPFNLV